MIGRVRAVGLIGEVRRRSLESQYVHISMTPMNSNIFEIHPQRNLGGFRWQLVCGFDGCQKSHVNATLGLWVERGG